MLNYEEELKKFKPCLDVDEVEDAIYSRDLTEDDIIDVMSKAEAVASYTSADGQTVEEVLPFADNIEFKA